MEGNKKRMTKAEAFEWLKCKKVDASNNECSVQSKLFSLGVVWRCTLNTNPCSSVKYLFINNECRMSHCGSDSDYYKYHCYKEISAEDILSIEIVEEEEEDTSMPTVEFERYVKILQAWSKRLNQSFVFSERGMGIVRGDLLTKLEGEEKGAYYKIEATL